MTLLIVIISLKWKNLSARGLNKKLSKERVVENVRKSFHSNRVVDKWKKLSEETVNA